MLWMYFPRVAAWGAVRGHVTAGPTPLPAWKTPHLTGSKIKTATGECEHRTKDAGTNKPDFGLVQGSVLERRDGTDTGRPPVLGKNNIC